MAQRPSCLVTSAWNSASVSPFDRSAWRAFARLPRSGLERYQARLYSRSHARHMARSHARLADRRPYSVAGLTSPQREHRFDSGSPLVSAAAIFARCSSLIRSPFFGMAAVYYCYVLVPKNIRAAHIGHRPGSERKARREAS